MAATTRSWKGYLKLSLVTCAVAMAAAQTDREKTRFHTLNKVTGNRLRLQWIDSETGDVVDEEDRTRGYEFAKGEHILVEDEDFDAIALESKSTIDVDQFVPEDEVDWLWTGDHHYLMPDDEVAVEAFAVIRDAMAKTDTNGIARVTINKRERWVLVAPREQGILITTLRYPYEVRSEAAGFERISGIEPDAKDVETMREVIRRMTKKWDPSKFEDRYENAVKKMLSEKQKGHVLKDAPAAPEAPRKHEKVVSMFEALRRSIEAEEKKRPKAESKKARGRKSTFPEVGITSMALALHEEFLLVRCLSCDHKAAMHWTSLSDHGATEETSLAELSRVMKCSKCESGSVELSWGNAATAAFYRDSDPAEE